MNVAASDVFKWPACLWDSSHSKQSYKQIGSETLLVATTLATDPSTGSAVYILLRLALQYEGLGGNKGTCEFARRMPTL
jgi:hypothetical protein